MSQAGDLLRRYFEPLLLSIQVVIDLAVVLCACVIAYHIRESVGWQNPTTAARTVSWQGDCPGGPGPKAEVRSAAERSGARRQVLVP